MNAREIKRRVKSVSFPNKPGTYIKIAGMKFKYSDED